MISYADFEGMNCATLSIIPAALTDVLLTDFGMGSRWEQIGRDALMDARAKLKVDMANVDVAIHADAVRALARFLSDRRFVETSPDSGERRLARLRIKCRQALHGYSGHAWFSNRACYGTTMTVSPVTAWADNGFILPTEEPGYRPIVLMPEPAKTGSGVNVCKFWIEEVDRG